VEKKNTEKI
jgi:hypothetical protein